jgi:uncharacterized protein (TIGR00255 family)
MTGYGRGSSVLNLDSDRSIIVELASVNRKTLDISAHLPREWQALEPEIAKCLRQRLHRGKVSVHVHLVHKQGNASLGCGAEALRATVAQLRELATEAGLPFEPDASALLKIIHLASQGVALPSTTQVKGCVVAAVQQALEEMVAMRAIEGQALVDDVLQRLGLLANTAKAIMSLREGAVPAYRDQLLQRLSKLGLDLDCTDERVLKEITIFADRCDVAEELTRLDSHFDQFRQTCTEAGPVGRKLDFLCQELNREINTVGSKAHDLNVTRHVMDMKNELERIREQVQNIE